MSTGKQSAMAILPRVIKRCHISKQRHFKMSSGGHDSDNGMLGTMSDSHVPE